MDEEQRRILEDISADFSEIIIMTQGKLWSDVKNRVTGVTYDMILDWSDNLKRVLEKT